MGHRISKVVTRTGDKGETSLSAKVRVKKNHEIIHALGTTDELNANIGLLMATLPDSCQMLKEELITIQHILFSMGATLASPEYNRITSKTIERLEAWITEHNQDLPPLKEFILPSGSLPICHAHLCRTVTRRLERILVSADECSPIEPTLIPLINRLSDYFFVIGRKIGKLSDCQEVYWSKEQQF